MNNASMENKEWGNKEAQRGASFRDKAKKAGMTPSEFAKRVLADGSKYDSKTQDQARLAMNLHEDEADYS